MKTKKYINVILYLLLICTAYSCKKSNWYDVKSDKSLAVPTTLEDLQALMDNANAMNTGTPGLGEVASDSHFIIDQNLLNSLPDERTAYTWTYDANFRTSQDWSFNAGDKGSYRRVHYANLVLETILKIKVHTPAEDTELRNIKGQALFHRAHAFYELAQIFAPPFEASNAQQKLGIPLRLTSDVSNPSKRSSLQETYDQIIADLNTAKDLLPESPEYRTRPSKQSVYALLARCYLSMEKYDQAELNASFCLNSYDTLLNYSTLGTYGELNPFLGYNSEIIFYSSGAAYNATSFYNFEIDRNLYDSYADNDLRKKAFFNINASNSSVNYKGTYSGQGFNYCFSGLATDEIYLIRAECYARAGRLIDAMVDLNKLLKTRWVGDYTDVSADDANDALQKVLKERKKELLLRGVRWSDLRRLNRDPRFAITLKRVVNGTTYTIEPNSYKYTMPIPKEVIEKTGMDQNPGWK